MASGLIHPVTVMLRPEPRPVRVSGLAPFDSYAVRLSGSLFGGGYLAGEMFVLRHMALTGELLGEGWIGGDPSVVEAVRLSGALTGGGTVRGVLTLAGSGVVTLSGAVSGTCTLTGVFAQAVAVRGETVGAGTLAGAPILTTALTGAAMGTGALAAAPILATNLVGAASGAGILGGAFSQAVTLAGAAVGGGSLLGTLRREVVLLGAARGSGTLGGVMTVTAAANEDADAASYLNAQTTAPSSTERALVDALVKGLKADGIWTKLDRLSLLAAETAQAARLCLRNPAKSMAATNLTASSFAANRGYTGDTAATGFLDFGEPFLNGASMFQQDSASVFVWCNNAISPVVSTGTGRVPQVGNTGAARVAINVLGAAGNNTWQVNVSVATAYTGSGNRSGFRCAVRPTSANQQVYTNGQLVSDISSTSSTPSTTNGCSHRSATTYGDDRLAVIGYGAALTATDVANLNTRLNTYLTAKGAA